MAPKDKPSALPESAAGPARLDPHRGPYALKSVKSPDGQEAFIFHYKLSLAHPCRLPYRYLPDGPPAVNGTINGQGRYPVLLDTGYSGPLLLSGRHIAENRLPVYDIPTPTGVAANLFVPAGLCHLDRLQLGELTLHNAAAHYTDRDMPEAFRQAVTLGLPLLRTLSYIELDGPRQEVELSAGEKFHPEAPAAWTHYPLRIESDDTGDFLYVKLPLAGQTVELKLDTGDPGGLTIPETLWHNVAPPGAEDRTFKDTKYYPFHGRFAGRRTVVERLSLGQRVVRGAAVQILDGNPLQGRGQGVIGLQPFRDTTMALDFERNRLWVRN